MEAEGNGKESQVVEENGVTVALYHNHDKPGKCKTFYNPKMKTCREFVLACLKVHVEDAAGAQHLTKCLDAFGATGVGGLQWKHHLQDKIEVTINEVSSESVANIRHNCRTNNMKVLEPLVPAGYAVTRMVPSQGTSTKCIEVVEADANVIMHLRQFNFINLDPYGSTVQFLSAAFRNVYNKGIVIVTSTDVASLYGKCPKVTLRNYGAYSQRTGYMKEMAARIVLAEVTRVAAQCNKGLEVVYTVAVEHFVQVAVRVSRGIQEADRTLTHLRHVLHCLMCEEYAICPDTRTPIESPYELLPCDCHRDNPGKTAIEVGPMWCGELYNIEFLQKMKIVSKDLNLSERVQSLLHTMCTEVRCPAQPKFATATNLTTDSGVNKPKDSGSPANGACDEKKDTKLSQPSGNATSETVITTEESSGKRKCLAEDEPSLKRCKVESRVPDDKMPPFYYDVHQRKIKNVDIPKAHKLVHMLQSAGYRASRTSFSPTAFRTNATVKQLKAVLYKSCKRPSSTPSVESASQN